MPVLLKGGQSTPSSSADGQAGSTTRPARPSTELNPSSSVDGRAGPTTLPPRQTGSTTRPVRPSAELNQSSLADGLAGSTTPPARRMAELDRPHYQLGGWPRWIDHTISSVVRRVGPVQSVRQTSWIN
ncbi:hypothetical protein DY000_02022145 [Brassica cretica]|uniref:Uncharacterized protein n=1 Tax=Brassica cretica TaxID=69181 RepID=A0ABQ7E5B4_BRACR|nr:hypothetical protein DY000_02022145 [Brassica cretica]